MSADTEYDSLVEKVLSDGKKVRSRNGNVLVHIGASMRFSLEGGKLPFVTKKKLAWKSCLRELLWFISGSTDSHVLSAKGSRIWDANGSREFLDSVGLHSYREGELGPVYGHQWRCFNAPYQGASVDHRGQGIDQLSNVVSLLSDPATRSSRRILLSSWNPEQIDEMALPPCHVLVQFNVVENKLFCCLYQRSGDVGLGVPFNIASYAFLTHLLAHHCGLEAAELYHTIGNAHIYESHIEGLRGYLNRGEGVSPTLSITEKRTTLDEYIEDDFNVNGYVSGDVLKLPFVA